MAGCIVEREALEQPWSQSNRLSMNSIESVDRHHPGLPDGALILHYRTTELIAPRHHPGRAPPLVVAVER
jgi:hypothetical protein